MQLNLTVTETSTDVSTNSSTISWSLSAYNDSANSAYNNYSSGSSAPTWGVNVGGLTSGGNFTYNVGPWGTVSIASGSGVIYHDSDGSKTISYSGEANGKNGSYFSAIYTSGTKVLTKIPRTSSISLTASSIDIGRSQTIKVTKALSSYTDVLTYSCEGATGTISSNASGDVSWLIPDAIENRMTTKTSATCTITCTTKNGSTVIGSTSKTFTVTVPNTYLPSINIGNTTFINAYNNKLIGNYSSITQEYTVSSSPAANSATISDISVSVNKGTISSKTSTSATTNVLPSENTDYTLIITIKATDTRGRSKTETKNIGTVYAFVAPAVSIQNLYRSDDQGSPIPEGTYAYTNVLINSEYAITVATATVNNSTYNLIEAAGSWMAILGNDDLDTKTQYNVVYSIRDQFMEDMGIPAISISQILTSMELPLSLFDNGLEYGVTLGEVATGPGFHIKMDNDVFENHVISVTNEDLDDYITQGMYYFSGEYTPLNIPVGVNGWLIVIKGNNDNYIKQIWCRHGTANRNDYDMYVRTRLVGTWSNWSAIITENSFVIATGTSSSITAGANSSGSISIPVTIPNQYKGLSIANIRSNGNVLITLTNGNPFGVTGNTSVLAWWRNPTSSSMSVTIVVDILCCKSYTPTASS